MRSLIAILAVGALVMIAGCQWPGGDAVSPEPVDPASGESTVDLNSATGGLSTADEEPAFGEPEEFASLALESAVRDPIASDTAVVDAAKGRRARLYQFRAVWGNLPHASDTASADCCPLDWSGTLHVDRGVIVMESAIAFEGGDLLSRIDRSTIAWISNTCPHVDGIQVKIVIPSSGRDSVCTDCPILHISTGPYSRSFSLAELEALNIVEPVDTCGNGIALTSVRMSAACPHGHLLGIWKKAEPDTIYNADSTAVEGVVLGRYRGIWIAQGGFLGGYIRGVFGLNASGERVFFGKYIDADGTFRGILRGTWGEGGDVERACETPGGFFKGEWIGSERLVQGRLRGHWIAKEDGAGYFQGVWGMLCSTSL